MHTRVSNSLHTITLVTFVEEGFHLNAIDVVLYPPAEEDIALTLLVAISLVQFYLLKGIIPSRKLCTKSDHWYNNV